MREQTTTAPCSLCRLECCPSWPHWDLPCCCCCCCCSVRSCCSLSIRCPAGSAPSCPCPAGGAACCGCTSPLACCWDAV